MEHRELELFLHLARTLNYGRTSLECHVSAATLTRTIQRLEVRAGARLLDRGPRGVVLTADGQRFTTYAQQALALWDEYRAGAGDASDLVGACQALLPDLLAPLRAAHPQIRLDVRTGDAAAALAGLDEGEVDAAVAGIPKRLPQTLVTRTVAVTDLVLVTAGESTADGPFVVPARGLVREAAFRWFRRTGIKPVIAAEPDGHEALLALVALGCGTGIVPRLVLESSPNRLTELPADLEPLTIGLCARRADLRRPLIAALWSLT
jgi:LysR family positive regulator for ilvC